MLDIAMTLLVYIVLLIIDLRLDTELTPIALLSISILSAILYPSPVIVASPLLLVASRVIEYLYKTRFPGIHVTRLIAEAFSLPLFFTLYGLSLVLMLGGSRLPGLDEWGSSLLYLTIYFMSATLLLELDTMPLTRLGDILVSDLESIEELLWRTALVSSIILAPLIYVNIHAYIIPYLILAGVALYYRRRRLLPRVLIAVSLAYALAVMVITGV